MNKYENVVIVDPKLDEEALSKVIDRFTKLINKHGKVFSVENNGLQELAYEIQKNKEAYYVIFTFESNPDFIEELQRNYRITDEILKFLVIKIDEIIVKEKTEKKTVVKSEVEVETEAKTEVKEEIKAEVETKVEVEEEPKAEVKVKTKIEVEEEPKVEVEKVETKTEVEEEPKVEAKVETKVEVEEEPKAEAKVKAKTEVKEEVKEEDEEETKAEAEVKTKEKKGK